MSLTLPPQPQPQPQPHPHRLSSCHRHPTLPITGFCAQCLSDRLAGVESVTTQPISAADLRRTKSYSAAKRDRLAGIPEPRRSSCDVRARNTLRDLFLIDNKWELETVNLGFQLKEEEEDGDEEEIRVLEDPDVNDHRAEKVEEFDEGIEIMTMKEHIDLEWQSKKNRGRDLKDSFRQVTSVFSNKLRKWRGKQKMKDVVATEAGKPCPKEAQSDREGIS